MPKANSALVWVGLVAAFILAAVLVVVFGPKPRVVPTEVVYVYTVRGIVESLPEEGRPMSEFRVKHEPIHDYKDRNGNVVGMGTMVMGFGITDPQVLSGLAVGDKIEFIWQVRPKGFPVDAVVSMTELPEDAEMNFGPSNLESGEEPELETGPGADTETGQELGPETGADPESGG